MMPLAALFLLLASTAPPLLPAYAHNDYENDRPLEEALELGYRGIEVDYFYVDGELLVAHDRRGVRPGRTLEALYLRPLRERIERLGSVQGDGSPFYLNIESKEEDRAGYEALRSQLAAYGDLLRVVESGRVREGPIVVTLVGWHPPAEELLREERRYAGIHRHIHELQPEDAQLPSHLLQLITVEYRRVFRWSGRDRRPRRFARGLERLYEVQSEYPQALLRVIRAPRNARVYEALLGAGVDLIAARDLERTAQVLRGIEESGE